MHSLPSVLLPRSGPAVARFAYLGLRKTLHRVGHGPWLVALLSFLALGLVRPGTAVAQEPQGAQVLQQMEQEMMDAIARAEQSVVAIARVRKPTLDDRAGDGGPPLGEVSRFGLTEMDPTSPDFIPNEFASGVVLDRAGYILTNYHVLGDPRENDYYVWVRRRPFRVIGVEVPEQVMAGDPWTDLAVLKIAANDLQPIQFGDASKLRKGMLVISLGNPYAIARDGHASASWGIVSNLRRSATPNMRATREGTDRGTLHHYGTLIQTDARLNLGTSGGALVNLQGEMVGLTTSLAAMPGYEQAAGYAIPVDDAFRQTVNTLKQGRLPAYGFLGVQPEHLTASERREGLKGTRVFRIVPGSPADEAGVRRDDIVTHVNGTIVDDRNALLRELGRLPAEATVQLTVNRQNTLRSGRSPRNLTAVLSKKYIAAAERAFAQVPHPTWRGMRVEYPTALPPELQSGLALVNGGQRTVAILNVDRDSSSWKAGLRPGERISHVVGQRVTTPAEFFRAVDELQGPVELQLLDADGESRRIEIPASR
jgi:serine protease Do